MIPILSYGPESRTRDAAHLRRSSYDSRAAGTEIRKDYRCLLGVCDCSAMRCAALQGKSVISNGDLTFALDRILMGAERKSLVMSDKVKVLTPESCRIRRMHRLTNACRAGPGRAVPCYIGRLRDVSGSGAPLRRN